VESTILQQLAPQYDAIVEAIYRAGSGLTPWLEPLGQMAEAFNAWTVQLLGVNKETGILAFSYETGSAPADAPVEYLRYYHRIDPRLAKSLRAPVGSSLACEEHFDESYVEKSRFYQEYLIPYGGRYLYGVKLQDDGKSSILLGHLTPVGRPPMSPAEKAMFRRLGEHCGRALDIEQTLAARPSQHSVGAELLEKMRQPMMLLDSHRRLVYRNRGAEQLFERGHLVHEVDGMLGCRDSQSDHDFTLALHSLALLPAKSHGEAARREERRSVRLRGRDGKYVVGTLLALRPEGTLGTFGTHPLALFTLFEPGAGADIDPFVLSATFDLTPAEARLAAMIVNGRTPEQCAVALGVKISTVRSHLVSVYGKTGTAGRAELVGLILSATAI